MTLPSYYRRRVPPALPPTPGDLLRLIDEPYSNPVLTQCASKW